MNLQYPFGLSLSKPCAALRQAPRERAANKTLLALLPRLVVLLVLPATQRLARTASLIFVGRSNTGTQAAAHSAAMSLDQSADQHYRDRVARVVAHIVAHPLAAHRLEDLAAIAHFSPFHFHRVYSSIAGETVAATVRRVRLALATRLLEQGGQSIGIGCHLCKQR
eukprot:gene39504-48813_t